MTAASTMEGAYTAVLSACQAAAATNTAWDLQVTDGPPIAYAAANYLTLLDVTGGTAPWAATRFAQIESYSIVGLVRAWSGGVEQDATRSTAFAILDALKTQLVSALDNGPLGWNPSASWRLEVSGFAQGPTSRGGWAHEATFAVHITNAYLDAT